MKYFCVLLVIALCATAGTVRAAIAPADTVTKTLEQGDNGETLRSDLLADRGLSDFVNWVNSHPDYYIRVDHWRSDWRWIPAGKSRKHTNSLNGGIGGDTEGYLNGIFNELGLKNLDQVSFKPQHPLKKVPTIRVYLMKREVKSAEPTVIREVTHEVVHEKPTIIKVGESFGNRFRLGASINSSPYNGAVGGNLEIRFDNLTSLQFTYGHSMVFFAQDRTVEGKERETKDQVLIGRLVHFPTKYVGGHIGLGRYENNVGKGIQDARHIMVYTPLLIGPSVRYGVFQGHLSFAFGVNDIWDRQNVEWQPKVLLEGTIYFWR